MRDCVEEEIAKQKEIEKSKQTNNNKLVNMPMGDF